MRKKRFAFVLAAALCAVSVGALAGCSGGTGGNSGVTPGGTAETKEIDICFIWKAFKESSRMKKQM